MCASVEIGHQKMNVTIKDSVSEGEIMARPHSHTRPSCCVPLLCFFFVLFFSPSSVASQTIEQITLNFTNTLSELLGFASDADVCCTHSYSV